MVRGSHHCARSSVNGVISAPPHKIYGSTCDYVVLPGHRSHPQLMEGTMPTIELKRIGDRLAPIDAKSMAILQKLPSDLIIKATGGWSPCKKRVGSLAPCRMRPFEGWPRSHWFQPACPNHMYAYLLCRARHSTVHFIDRCEVPLDFELGPENSLCYRTKAQGLEPSTTSLSRGLGIRHDHDPQAGVVGQAAVQRSRLRQPCCTSADRD